jgi:NitT/TauT family transport system substrate-binding protein
MTRRYRLGLLAAAAWALAAAIQPAGAATAPLRIGFSDWPGWTPWQIAIDKGWFKQAGVDVQMQWFDYSASLDAFSAGKLDADCVANGDALGTGANGAKNVMILLTDYSSGNDQVVGAPGVKSVKQLKGKKVGVEVGLVDHLLLERALKVAGMKLTDITLVNAKTNETPQVLASGSVSAIAAWQPIAGQAVRQAPGARPIFTSANAPGLIYDALTVSPQSLNDRRADWMKVIGVWYKVVAYMRDPKTAADALKIMAARDGVDPATYKPYVKGTHILSLAEARKAFKKGPGLDSIYGSDANADDFNVRNGVYKVAQDGAAYVDPSLTAAFK